jgi:uncharacterized protein (TIGR03437 family)
VDFFNTTIPRNGAGVQYQAPVPSSTLTGKSGSTIPGAVVVIVGTQNGFLPNIGVRIENDEDPTLPSPAACNGPGGVVLTDSNGTATCDLVLSGPPGTTRVHTLVGEIFNSAYYVQVTPGATCTYSLSASSASPGSNGGSGSVNVITTSTCGWTATSNASWITITAGSSGTGNGTVSYQVQANNTGVTRSGTITAAGQTYTVNQSGTVTPPSGLAITPQSFPVGTVNASYSATLAATGGQPPYTWSISGTLPAGLGLTNSATGLISGTPQASGTFPFTATVHDNLGASAGPQNFSIVINTAGAPGSFTITNSAFPGGVIGQPYRQLLTTANACSTPFSHNQTFTILSGSLPPGLGISSNGDGTFSITGTPTASGSFPFTLKATDACGGTTSANFTINIGTTTPPPTQQLTANPTSLSFTVQLGSSNVPTNQTVNLLVNTGSLSYTVGVATSTGSNWLVAKSALSGSAPGSFTVGVANYSTLAPGPYTGSITFTSPALNQPLTVVVNLTVLAAPTLLLLSPNAVTINQVATTGTSLTSTNIVLGTDGNPLNFTLSVNTPTGGKWLSATSQGTSAPTIVTATINSGGLAPNTYIGTVIITPVSGAALTVTITLIVTPPPPSLTNVENGASFTAGAVAPGEIVLLVGSLLGPATQTAFHITQSGRLDTTLAGTQAFFNGFAAPLISTSAGRILAIVPYEVAGNSVVSVFVTNLGVRSNTIALPVADTAPGILMLDATGQGVILNEDGSFNSIQNGAEPESVVSILATGEGQTRPPGVDGVITGNAPPTPRAEVTAQIAGQDAKVTSASGVPGAPAGIFRVNVTVPAGVPRGTSVPVVVSVGNASSQSGVTLAIKP